MNTALRLEEETLPWYSPEQFYPVHIGQIVDARYKVVAKLGYGAHSTVWLCRDIRDAGFVAIKVCTRDANQSAGVHRELQFYTHVSSLDSKHPGQSFIRGLLETFEMTGPTGQHLCLVHPPMHMTIRQLQCMNSSRRLNEPLLRWTLSNLLSALSFLHDDAGVVHADINPSNIMLTVDDESVLEHVEEAESANPLPRKVVDDVRTIYSSHSLGLPKDALWGHPVLCDFGEARIGRGCHKGLIQPELYRAPEVLFEMGWTSSADIWSVATLLWDLFENKHLFNALDNDQKSSATYHVAQMVAYLGPPPPEYIQRSDVSKNVFDEQGYWKRTAEVPVPQRSLETSLTALDGEDKVLFLRFIRDMLAWMPEQRKQATELLKDAWLSKNELTARCEK